MYLGLSMHASIYASMYVYMFPFMSVQQIQGASVYMLSHLVHVTGHPKINKCVPGKVT